MLASEIDYEFWGFPQIGTTQFRVACTDSDYEECKILIEGHGWPSDYELHHPTIMAERDGELVGCMCTRYVGTRPLAGPLALQTDVKRPVLAYKLLLQYERALRNMGEASIWFDVDIGSDMERAVLKAVPSMTPFHTEGGRNHYVWSFDNIQRVSEEDAA